MKTNYLAVIVSAAAYWLLGGLWYAVLFSKRWMALEHLPEAGNMNPVLPYVITLALNLLIAFALAQLIKWRNAGSAVQGAGVGALVWIGFLGPVTYTTSMYEMRPKELFAINEGYSLVGFILMGAILGAWKKKV